MDRLNILVVDDSTAIRSLITAKLHELAAEIDIARGSESGLASAIRLYVLRHYRG